MVVWWCNVRSEMWLVVSWWGGVVEGRWIAAQLFCVFSGAQRCSVSCIDEGMPMAGCRLVMSYGGDDMDTLLRYLLHRQQLLHNLPPLTSPSTTEAEKVPKGVEGGASCFKNTTHAPQHTHSAHLNLHTAQHASHCTLLTPHTILLTPHVTHHTPNSTTHQTPPHHHATKSNHHTTTSPQITYNSQHHLFSGPSLQVAPNSLLARIRHSCCHLKLGEKQPECEVPLAMSMQASSHPKRYECDWVLTCSWG